MSAAEFEIRPARREDLDAIHAMILALAEYEKLAHLCVGTAADLDAALFGPRPAAEVLVAFKGGKPAAFALFFHNFSTFLGRRGLWLEDLFVRPEYRRQGCAHALSARARRHRPGEGLRPLRVGGPGLERARDRVLSGPWRRGASRLAHLPGRGGCPRRPRGNGAAPLASRLTHLQAGPAAGL